MEDKSKAVWELLKESRSIALLTARDPEECVKAYEILSPLGIVLEIAFRNEHALPGIESVLETHPDALLLAGTVLTREQAEAALGLGVAGIVSPDYLPDVLEASVEADVMCVPGGMADLGKQLVRKAELYGCTLEELRRGRPWQWIYKVFPAMADETARRETVDAWKAIYPDVCLVYSGGVTPDNVGRLFRQDPTGVFCGSSLLRRLDDPPRARRDAEHWLREVEGGVAGASVVGSRAEASPSSAAGGTEMSGPGQRRVVTFGETLLRLSAPLGTRLRQATSLDVAFGGAEANVAAALAQWGLPSRYLTVLPEHDFGDEALSRLRALGVDTSAVLRREGRMGVYFLEHGVSHRPSRVIYDRAESALARLGPGDVNWEDVLSDARWFHWSGITPALSRGAEELIREGVRVARDLGLTVSLDLNYRSMLWPLDRAREVMGSLVEHVDVLVGNVGQLSAFFGQEDGDPPRSQDVTEGRECERLASRLVDRIGLDLVAVTSREGDSASEVVWGACLHDGASGYGSRRYRVQVVDGIGGGDAFSAGLIYGTLTGMERQDALEFGAAAATLKQTMAGDVLLATAEEVRGLASGEGGGGIQR
jgi:2-dehydro-3-deoxygluconokinase